MKAAKKIIWICFYRNMNTFALENSAIQTRILKCIFSSLNAPPSDKGAIALAETLKINSKLDRLFLKHNQISDAGAIALVEALKVNLKLNWLYLEHNQISDNGAAALADALKVNSKLTYLSLQHN